MVVNINVVNYENELIEQSIRVLYTNIMYWYIHFIKTYFCIYKKNTNYFYYFLKYK